MELNTEITTKPPRISNIPIPISYSQSDSIIPSSSSPTTPPCMTQQSSPTNNNNNNNNSNPLTPPNPNPNANVIVLSPCAACKILRRRCVQKCVLAPYFPPTDPLKFTIAHRVFGAANITKFLQEIPERHREDAVSSMVYEAKARIRDPVYGSAGAICQLQKQISELQFQLAMAQAEVLNIQHQKANLITLLCTDISTTPVSSYSLQQPNFNFNFNIQQVPFNNNNNNNNIDTSCFLEDLGTTWEPLWA